MYDESTNRRYDFPIDIFPLGCIFGYTLSGGKHPFVEDEHSPIGLISAMVRMKEKMPMLLVQDNLKEPYSSDGSAIKLIQTMVDMDPGKRPTVADVLRADFFNKTQNEMRLVENHQPFSWVRCFKDISDVVIWHWLIFIYYNESRYSYK